MVFFGGGGPFPVIYLLFYIHCRGLAKCNITVVDTGTSLYAIREVGGVLTNMEKTFGLKCGRYGSWWANRLWNSVHHLSLLTTSHWPTDTDTYRYSHFVTSSIYWLVICCKKDIQWRQLNRKCQTGVPLEANIFSLSSQFVCRLIFTEYLHSFF